MHLTMLCILYLPCECQLYQVNYMQGTSIVTITLFTTPAFILKPLSSRWKEVDFYASAKAAHVIFECQWD